MVRAFIIESDTIFPGIKGENILFSQSFDSASLPLLLWYRLKGLNVTCSEQVATFFYFKTLCRGRESNPHSLRNTILSRTRLPIPPPRHTIFKYIVVPQ